MWGWQVWHAFLAESQSWVPNCMCVLLLLYRQRFLFRFGQYAVTLCSRAVLPSVPLSLRLYFQYARVFFDVLFERNVVCWFVEVSLHISLWPSTFARGDEKQLRTSYFAEIWHSYVMHVKCRVLLNDNQWRSIWHRDINELLIINHSA
jgi:hypothetical protein